jgi:hypothetical protein
LCSAGPSPDRRGLDPKKVLVVAKPYMTRRGFATGRAKWPEAELLLQCEAIDMLDYFAREPDPDRTLLALVGDLHRIVVHPALGYSIAQDLPPPVIAALRALVAAGYGARLLADYELDGTASRRSRLPRR